MFSWLVLECVAVHRTDFTLCYNASYRFHIVSQCIVPISRCVTMHRIDFILCRSASYRFHVVLQCIVPISYCVSVHRTDFTLCYNASYRFHVVLQCIVPTSCYFYNLFYFRFCCFRVFCNFWFLANMRCGFRKLEMFVLFIIYLSDSLILL